MQLETLKQLFREWSQYQTSKHVEKDPGIWVFGAMRGRRYFDNAKYLFEYVSTKTETRAIWISKDGGVVQKIRNKGFEAYLESSPEARHYAERAQVAVITHRGNRANSDIPFQWLNKHTFLVQLWHGIPLKKIAFDDTHFSYKHDENSLWWRIKDHLKRWFFPFRHFVNYPSLIPASSEETRELFASAFRVPLETVAVTGYPRNDRIFSDLTTVAKHRSVQKVIYMPTFRGKENSNFDLFTRYGFDASKMEDFLCKNDLSLDVKLHPFNHPSSQLMEYIDRSNRINLLDCDDIYEALGNYEYLITDYSSIYFDFLLLNRPVIFAPFDKDSYLGKEREFYFSYDEVTPGPKSRNWDEVISHIAEFANSPDWYTSEREETLARFHAVVDNSNCRRIYNEISERVNKRNAN